MNYRQQIPLLFADIRFWIVFFFLIRMYGITLPPLEVGHNWRQTDGLMIARNFYERDPNIFFPAVDLAGEKTGIVGSEFPILNYLIYLLSLVFGYEHWYGRIVVLLFSSIGIFFFYKLIRKYFGEAPAFNASIVLLVSLWFSYSRKNIPDAFAVSLCIISLYYAFQYFDTGKYRHLLLFFFLALLGCLSKIIAGVVLTVLIIPLVDTNRAFQKKAMISLFSAMVLLAVFCWYYIWVPYLNATYGYGDHFFMGKSFAEGAAEILDNWPLVLKRLYATPLKYTGFLAFVVAVFLVIRKKDRLPLMIFLITFITFLIFIFKTGSSIVGDNYYILTLIPSMAFLTGYGLAQIGNTRMVTIALIIISVEGIADQIYDFRLREPFKSLGTLEAIMDKVSDRDDLIVINAQFHNPTAMYFAHRRGWAAPNEFITDSTYFSGIKNKGCKYIVVARKLYGDLNLNYPLVHDSEYFKIYRVE